MITDYYHGLLLIKTYIYIFRIRLKFRTFMYHFSVCINLLYSVPLTIFTSPEEQTLFFILFPKFPERIWHINRWPPILGLVILKKWCSWRLLMKTSLFFIFILYYCCVLFKKSLWAILETRDRIPCQAPGAWSLLLPLPVSLPLYLYLCVTVINKIKYS